MAPGIREEVHLPEAVEAERGEGGLPSQSQREDTGFGAGGRCYEPRSARDVALEAGKGGKKEPSVSEGNVGLATPGFGLLKTFWTSDLRTVKRINKCVLSH